MGNLSEWVQNVRDKRRPGEQPNSLEEIKAELASQLDPSIRSRILSKTITSEAVEEVWKKLVEMSWMIETTSFPTEEVYMKARYLCTICQMKMPEVLLFSQGSEGKTICTVKLENKQQGANISIRIMRKAHVEHMITHTGKGVRGTLPVFGNYVKASESKPARKRKLQECDLCDFSSTSKGELTQHRDNVHFPEEKICPFCDRPFQSRFFRDRHVLKAHKVSPPRSMAKRRGRPPGGGRAMPKSKHRSKEEEDDMKVEEEEDLEVEVEEDMEVDKGQDMEVDEVDEVD